MNNREKDIFETTNKKKADIVNDNFFLIDDSLPVSAPNSTIRESARRLNDYDFNLLKEDAYKDVSDDLFKLEYKISRIEEEIKAVDVQINSAREIGDYELIMNLSTQKTLLEEDKEALIAIYNDKSFSAKISDKILNVFGGKIRSDIEAFQSRLSNLSESFLSKLPKQFSSIIELKKTLIKLENLNKSVDELVSLNIPYGENINKYEQLSKYIIKANSIQAEISRYIKK